MTNALLEVRNSLQKNPGFWTAEKNV